MNLETARAKQNFEDKVLPKKLERLRDITSPEIVVDVDWTGFSSKDDINMIANGFFDRLIADLEKLCKDKIGREAFNQRVKRIVVRCVETKGEKHFNLEGDTLTAWGAWGKSEGYIGYDEYRKYLEKNL